MKATQAATEVMKLQGLTISKLADRLGKGVRLISERMRQENISVEKLNEVLRAMDYKVVIVPRDSRLPEGGYEVE